MLCVRDIDRSIAFYRDVLDFEVTQEWSWIAAVEGAGHRVYLLSEGTPTEDEPDAWLVPRAERGRGSVTLVLRVDDCDAAYEAVRARGGAFVTRPETPRWGGRRCFLNDPDGYLVEIEQPRE
jgi:lactoylglutathione lyase